MKVSRISPVTRRKNTLEIDITPEELREIDDPAGRCIQDIAPHLTADEREFLISGATASDWDKLFKQEERSPRKKA